MIIKSELAGVLWSGEDAAVRERCTEELCRTLTNLGYRKVNTPHIVKETTAKMFDGLFQFKAIIIPKKDRADPNDYSYAFGAPKNINHVFVYEEQQPRTYQQFPLCLFEIGEVYDGAVNYFGLYITTFAAAPFPPDDAVKEVVQVADKQGFKAEVQVESIASPINVDHVGSDNTKHPTAGCGAGFKCIREPAQGSS